MDREAKTARAKVGAKPRAVSRARPRAVADTRTIAQRLADAVAQQAATTAILRVMSASPTDVQPVMDAVAEQAARLCHAPFARVMLVDGDVIRPLAPYSVDGESEIPVHAVPLARTTISGRAIVDRKTVHHADIVPLLDTEFPAARENAMATGFRAVLAVPLIGKIDAYGVIFLWRREPGLFAPDQVALVETFATQAAIAIENVRLFHATREALEQQTATSEILRVISSSPTDVQPVFETIAANALRLCDARRSAIFRFDGELIHVAALRNLNSQGAEALRNAYPAPPSRGSPSRRAILTGGIVHIADVLADPEYEHRDVAKAADFRSVLSVPMLRDGHAIGTITVYRDVASPFPDMQIELLKTFADQAVIAIENVRLFSELEVRNRDLTEALEQQTATSEILRVISSSPTDVQPVFETIAANALRLCDARFSAIFRFDGELIHIGAFQNLDPDGAIAFRTAYPCRPSRGGTTQRAILTGRIVHMPDIRTDPEYVYQDVAKAADYRSVLSVPMLRDGQPIGTITVYRDVARPFPDTQIELLKTFADQAVIAIENVRLFSELEVRNRDLTTALDQRTATAEILRVISSSPTDVQPVFHAIVRSAVQLCGAQHSLIFEFDGELLKPVSRYVVSPEFNDYWVQHPMRPGRGSISGLATLERKTIHVPDVLALPGYEHLEAQQLQSYRTVLAVPMLRGETVIGVITTWKSQVEPFTDKQVELVETFADQAVIAIENVRLFNELEARNRDLTEALEQQTATSDILRVISRSQTDVQPVFDTIAAAALKLCDASSANVVTFDGEMIHLAALANLDPTASNVLRQLFPRPPSRDIGSTRAVLTGRVVAIPDVLNDADYALPAAAVSEDFRSVLAVPLLRDGTPIGAIGVGRPQVGTFPDKQIALLQTFADQAVIAIENVRLFKELEVRNRDLTEALEQQTATSDILRVISQSQTDVQPVFDTIAKAALELCSASSANVFTFDGELIHLVPLVHLNPGYIEAMRKVFPRPPGRDTAITRAILTCSVVAIPDVREDTEYVIEAAALAGGFRSVLAVPLVREGSPIGAIAVGRPEPGPFPDTQVELMKTFADQAVIAIENVRLFKELEARNRDLTEALEQQTATSDILRVISRSQTDVQPVFDTIAKAAHDLCRATSSNVLTYDGNLLHLAAFVNPDPAYVKALRGLYPRPLSGDTAVHRAIMTRSVVAIPDVIQDSDYVGALAARSIAGGFRSALAVPLMREGIAIGGIAVGRAEAGPFPDTQVSLLQTFADQAVIAIENVRLFKELEAQTNALTRSVSELKALGDVGQAVSSTLDLETVLSTIVSRAVQLTGMDGGSIYEYDEAREEFYLHTADRLPDELVEAMRATPMRKGEGVLGLMAMIAEPVQIRDIIDERSYQSRIREVLLRLGYRSILAVPLMRDNRLMGGLAVNRKTPGEFDSQVIDLLKTFATQSALAIQNARLFREIEVKSRQLETASRHKSEFLANMSHELRTPLNAIIGFSEVLSERLFGDMNEKQAEYVGDISESGRHLLNLINDILDLSKIEAGRMELDPSDFDIATTVDNTLSLVRERAQRRAITLRCTVDPRLATIHADERKVKQVLLNLLSNALKFTPEGGAIEVRATAHDDRTEIAVTDTGVGIAPEDQEAVFEEFRQVGSTAKKIEGTGLGLAISRKFIELHGGKIWVTSQLGVGSTFTFTLPLR